MKYLVMLGLLCMPAISYAQEIVVIKERNEYYAVVTDCQAKGRPIKVDIKKLERGQESKNENSCRQTEVRSHKSSKNYIKNKGA